MDQALARSSLARRRPTAPIRHPPRVHAAGSLCGGSDPCWFEGVSEYSYFPNCPALSTGNGWVNSWTGYWISGNGNYPATGDRYYGHIVAGVVGYPCAAGKFISTEIILPAHTHLDPGSDPNGHPRCYFTNSSNQTSEVTNEQDAHCNSYGPGQHNGSISLGGRIVPQQSSFEIVFPLRSDAPLQGLGGNDRMVAPVETEDSNSLIAPQQWVTVTRSTLSATGQRSGANDVVHGHLGPVAAARAGAQVRVTFFRKRNGVFRKFAAGPLPTDASGDFAGQAPRPGNGTCKVQATYPMKHPVASASDTFGC